MRASAVVVLAAIALPTRATADDRQEAAASFAKGQAADKRRAWAEAIEHYKRANELLPHPNAIYNIAVDYERLSRYRDAATWFDAYLDAAPTATDRERVNKKILDLRNRPAKIIVRSHPAGARVMIQGLPAGSTPLTTEREGGIYRVVVEKAGERDARDITVEYGEPVEIDVQLKDAPVNAATTTRPPAERPLPPPVTGAPGQQPPAGVLRPGFLVVAGTPVGAFVSIDNEPAGSVPLRLAVMPGVHRISVRAAGYQPLDTTVTITPDHETTIDAAMPRALGSFQAERPPLNFHYFVGGIGGVDARAEDNPPLAAMGELGFRASKYDLAARVGSIGGELAFDAIIRYALVDAVFTPYGGFGYSYTRGSAGWELLGGLRFDLTKSQSFGVSAIAEIQLRYYVTTEEGATTGVAIPILGGLQILYR